MPDRIQLSRAKGWRMPPNTVKVDRTTVFGNPFTVAQLREAGWKTGTDDDLATVCVVAFMAWVHGSYKDWMGPESEAVRAKLLAELPRLRGKNLACWCKPGSPCHATALLEIANA